MVALGFTKAFCPAYRACSEPLLVMSLLSPEGRTFVCLIFCLAGPFTAGFSSDLLGERDLARLALVAPTPIPSRPSAVDAHLEEERALAETRKLGDERLSISCHPNFFQLTLNQYTGSSAFGSHSLVEHFAKRVSIVPADGLEKVHQASGRCFGCVEFCGFLWPGGVFDRGRQRLPLPCRRVCQLG